MNSLSKKMLCVLIFIMSVCVLFSMSFERGKKGAIFDVIGDNIFDTVQVSTEVLERFLGVYNSDEYPLSITVFLDEEQLMAQANGQDAFPLTTVDERNFIYEPEGIQMGFEPEENKMIFQQGTYRFEFRRANELTVRRRLSDVVSVAEAIAVDPLERFAGKYTSTDFHLVINIFVENGQLMGQAAGQEAFPLAHVFDNVFDFEAASIRVDFRADDEMVFIQFGRRFLYRRVN